MMLSPKFKPGLVSHSGKSVTCYNGKTHRVPPSWCKDVCKECTPITYHKQNYKKIEERLLKKMKVK